MRMSSWAASSARVEHPDVDDVAPTSTALAPRRRGEGRRALAVGLALQAVGELLRRDPGERQSQGVLLPLDDFRVHKRDGLVVGPGAKSIGEFAVACHLDEVSARRKKIPCEDLDVLAFC